MKTTTLVATLLLGSVMTGCVTINIYFPAAAAEKAADKIIDEIWQLKQGTKPQVDQPQGEKK